jgi:signal transduction histidine kinase
MIRTVVDVTFDDPNRDAADYEAMRRSILSAVQRSATLIDRLLELAQAQQRPQLGPIDLATVAEECLATVDARANSHHTAIHITARPEGGLVVTANAPNARERENDGSALVPWQSTFHRALK